MAEVKLKEFMQTIRRELETADQERETEGKAALFELQQMELELKVVVMESKSKQGGFDVKVLSAEGSRSAQAETVQTVRLTYRVAPSAKAGPRYGSKFHSSTDQASEETGIEVLRRDT